MKKEILIKLNTALKTLIDIAEIDEKLEIEIDIALLISILSVKKLKKLFEETYPKE